MHTEAYTTTNLSDRSKDPNSIASPILLPLPKIVSHQTNHLRLVAQSRISPTDQAVFRIGLNVGDRVVAVFEQVIPATAVLAVAEIAVIEMLDVPGGGGDSAFRQKVNISAQSM